MAKRKSSKKIVTPMINSDEENDWGKNIDAVKEETNLEVSNYDITSSPNDFNIKTIFDFIESGVVKIPFFQRNYIWDLSRASKLIESIIVGLPIPQIFLYEENKNQFLVIDGHQRLMTIYYFIKKRFPRIEKRIELREIFDKQGQIPDKIISDKEYFRDFNLYLPRDESEDSNPLHGLNYNTLDDYKRTFELRTIRNVIIKETNNEEESAMYEIFNRLNTGGVNLKPQEIRTSLFYSDFYKMLSRINLNPDWRFIINKEAPDVHMRDVELILRCFAMLIKGKKYKPSMTKFLNAFSKEAKEMKEKDIKYLENLFIEFAKAAASLGDKVFYSKNKKLNISSVEAIFRVMSEYAYRKKNLEIKTPLKRNLTALKKSIGYNDAILEGTASVKNVDARYALAKKILFKN